MRMVKHGSGAQRSHEITIIACVQNLTGQVPKQPVLVRPDFSAGWTSWFPNTWCCAAVPLFRIRNNTWKCVLLCQIPASVLVCKVLQWFYLYKTCCGLFIVQTHLPALQNNWMCLFQYWTVVKVTSGSGQQAACSEENCQWLHYPCACNVWMDETRGLEWNGWGEAWNKELSCQCLCEGIGNWKDK